MSTDLDYAWDAYYAERADDFRDEPEPDCDCRFSGDQADASDCELHGDYRKPMGRADSSVWVKEVA